MTKQRSAFWHKARQIFLCLTMLLMFERAIVPAPAAALIPIKDPMQAVMSLLDAAKKIGGWAMEKMQLTSFITTLTDQYDSFTKNFTEWFNKIFDTGAAEVAYEQVETQRKIRQYDAIMEARTQDAIAAVNAEVIAKMAPPKNQQLCKSILVHQLVSTTMDFAREVSRMIVEGISNRARYAGSSEPLQVMQDLVARCGGDLKMGSRLDGHSGCYDSTTLAIRGTDGRGGENMDLFAIDGSQVYEMPMIQSEQYTDPDSKQSIVVRYPAIPSGVGRDYDNQRFWMGQFYGLYNLVGARPIPLSGNSLRSPVGLTQRVMYNHCLANQNALIKQCADELAFFTRPNSKDPALQPLRDLQNKMCKAASKSLDMKRFGNCEQGLSAYEAHEIQEQWCLATNHTLAVVAGGHDFGAAMESTNLCNDSATAWANLKTRVHENCTAAAAAISSMEECWQAVEVMGAPPKSSARKSSAVQSVPKAALHKISAEGQSGPLDTKSLPHTVGQ